MAGVESLRVQRFQVCVDWEPASGGPKRHSSSCKITILSCIAILSISACRRPSRKRMSAPDYPAPRLPYYHKAHGKIGREAAEYTGVGPPQAEKHQETSARQETPKTISWRWRCIAHLRAACTANRKFPRLSPRGKATARWKRVLASASESNVYHRTALKWSVMAQKPNQCARCDTPTQLGVRIVRATPGGKGHKRWFCKALPEQA